jgi:outer membrane protein OmpA-like peptidoglycan-associated protein
MTGYAGTHFGVRDKALIVPPDVAETEEVTARAEKSGGAKNCPDKIEKAKALAKEAVDVYWSCQDAKAMGMLADARKIAKEAESCQPTVPAAVVPPPVPSAVVKQPIAFHTVYFDFDKSNMKPAAVIELDRTAKIMREDPDVVLELQGNTDAVGTRNYNTALGLRRAASVFNYLQSKGKVKTEIVEIL